MPPADAGYGSGGALRAPTDVAGHSSDEALGQLGKDLGPFGPTRAARQGKGERMRGHGAARARPARLRRPAEATRRGKREDHQPVTTTRKSRTTSTAAATDADDWQEQAAASRERLAAAKARRNDLIDQRDRLVSPETIKARWRAGSEECTALDYVAAAAEHERAVLLIEAAAREVERAKRSIIPGDVSLAEAVAAALADLLGIEADALAIAPKSFAHPEGAAPRLVIVQQGEHGQASDGALSGTVTAHLVRGAWHRGLDGPRVLDALQGSGWLFGQHTPEAALTTTIDGGEVDELPIDIGRAWPVLPTLRGEVDLDQVADALGGLVSAGVREAERRVGVASRRITPAHETQPVLLADESDGERRLVTIDAQLLLSVERLTDTGELIDTTRRVVVSRLPGKYIPAGRIDSAQLVHAGPITADGVHLDGVAVTVRVTAMSKVVPA